MDPIQIRSFVVDVTRIHHCAPSWLPVDLLGFRDPPRQPNHKPKTLPLLQAAPQPALLSGRVAQLRPGDMAACFPPGRQARRGGGGPISTGVAHPFSVPSANKKCNPCHHGGWNAREWQQMDGGVVCNVCAILASGRISSLEGGE